MEAFSQFVLQHGYLLLAGWVFLDQLGVPIPAVPVLVAAGALVGVGALDPATSLAACVVGALPSDLLWYEVGRRRGGAALRLLCRLSLEPDSCVRTTEETFLRHGPRSLLVAKFIPGYQTLAPPLAGISGMPLAQFVLWSIPSALLWSGAFLGLGFVFHDQLDRFYQVASELGSRLLMGFVLALLGYLGWRFFQRQRFLRSLRVARIEPRTLKGLLASADDVTLVDLRTAMELELDPRRIPTATLLSIEDIEERHVEIPRDRDIVIYCN